MTPELAALLLKAISLVESGGRDDVVGRHGELGRFQMTPAVVASCGGYREREALRNLRLIERQFEHAGIAPLPFNVALAWNAGLGAVQRGRAPVASYDYARRVCNTLERLEREVRQ